MNKWQHLKAILALPFLVLVGVPLVLLSNHVPRWLPRMYPWNGLTRQKLKSEGEINDKN
ncbi:MAG: hypothetical protein ACTSQI_12295 [Candidatus Helarchaeota archaeon]